MPAVLTLSKLSKPQKGRASFSIISASSGIDLHWLGSGDVTFPEPTARTLTGPGGQVALLSMA